MKDYSLLDLLVKHIPLSRLTTYLYSSNSIYFNDREIAKTVYKLLKLLSKCNQNAYDDCIFEVSIVFPNYWYIRLCPVHRKTIHELAPYILID